MISRLLAGWTCARLGCDHNRAEHKHYHSKEYCSFCDCPAFRWFRRR